MLYVIPVGSREDNWFYVVSKRKEATELATANAGGRPVRFVSAAKKHTISERQHANALYVTTYPDRFYHGA